MTDSRQERKIWIKDKKIILDCLTMTGKTQNSLAKEINITEIHLSRVLNKKICVGLSTVKALLTFFDVFSFNDLFYIEYLKEKQKTRNETMTEEQIKEIREKEKIQRQKYKEKQAIYHAKWYEKNGIKLDKEQKEKLKKWRQDNPEKVKASNILNKAVETRKIKRPLSCSNCGKTNTKIIGHHHDYNKPLDIIWLCSSCHRLIHSKTSNTSKMP